MQSSSSNLCLEVAFSRVQNQQDHASSHVSSNLCCRIHQPVYFCYLVRSSRPSAQQSGKAPCRNTKPYLNPTGAAESNWMSGPYRNPRSRLRRRCGSLPAWNPLDGYLASCGSPAWSLLDDSTSRVEHRRLTKPFAREGKKPCARAGRRPAARVESRCEVISRAHICALGRRFSELAKDGEEGWKTVGGCFFSICQKMKDEEEGWETVGVALSWCLSF